MSGLLKTLSNWKNRAGPIAKALVCHRAIYAGLALCHGSGCFLTEKPELYGPMALFYTVLALRG